MDKKIFCPHNIDFLSLFIITSLCLFGLFYEFSACIAGIALCVYLCLLAVKNHGLNIYLNLTSLFVVLTVLLYGLSVFWAVDKGAAVIGFFKFLPILFFVTALMQKENDSEKYLCVLPYTAAVMTIISAVLMQIPVLEKWFSVAGRLSGFFQYPNTFALFLLISLIITLTKEKLKKTDFLIVLILIFGIVYSGSRTVFVLMLLASVSFIIFSRSRAVKIVFALSVLTIIGAAFAFALLTKNFDSIGRFLTISVRESTLVGRFLYFYDALPLILKHPFGLGYLGYYYIQSSVQTGVYSVMYVHNDFLQIVLDVGWVPAAVFIAAILRAFFKKGASLQKRLLIFVITAHTIFDFNFQYVAVFMLFIMLLDCKGGKKVRLSLPNSLFTSAGIVVTLLFLYMGTAQTLSYFKQYAASSEIYPWNTQNDIALLIEEEDTAKADKIADRIIKRNSHVAIAYDAKARFAYSNGVFEDVINYKKKSIDISPFTYETYEDYCRMLINGIYLYEKAGDDYSAEFCQKELLSAVNRLERNGERLSELGKLVNDQPKTELPDDILACAEAVKNEN